MDIDSHEISCLFKAKSQQNNSNSFICTFNKLGCDVTFNNQKDLDDHLKNAIQDHITVSYNNYII